MEVSRSSTQTVGAASQPESAGSALPSWAFPQESELLVRRVWEAEEGRALCTPLPCSLGSIPPVMCARGVSGSVQWEEHGLWGGKHLGLPLPSPFWQLVLG